MNCQICVGEMSILAEYDCKHQICVACSVRLIYLYKQVHCPLCKQPAKLVVFSSLHQDASQKLFGRTSDDNPSRALPRVVYANDEVKAKVEDLLSKKCQRCPQKFSTFKQLKKHYLDHGILLCNECIEHKKDFWNEIKLYKSETLKDHKNGILGEQGFDGHVHCTHCRIYLFDSDDAKKHCNLNHELCHICDVLGMKHQYYNGFSDLETHYRNSHYCCTFQGCQINKCYVFPYKTELFEHLIRFHKINIKISEIADHGKCSLPVMNPLSKEKSRVQAVVLDPNGRRIADSLSGQMKRITINSASKARTPVSSQKASASDLPTYLNRNVLAEERLKERRRRFWMDRICKVEADEIERIINAFLTDSATVVEAFDQIKALVGGDAALKLFESIHFDSKQAIVSENVKIFRRDIMFPKFKPEEPVRYEEPERKKKAGFKIIDLIKKK